jgi:hypothetical protein
MLYKKEYKLIKKLFDEDQNDRISRKILKYSDKKRWKIISSRDKKRLEIIKAIVKKTPLEGIDYFRAGIIAQHSSAPEGIRFAQFLAKESIKKRYEKAKWLYAAATDRLLIMKKKPQKYGTQYGKFENKWKLFPTNKKTTDKERARYNIAK